MEVDEPSGPAPKRQDVQKLESDAAAAEVEPPSWSRVGKRALIFAPLMLVVGSSCRASRLGAMVPQAILLLVFLPFSYLMDTMMYRSYQRRTRGRSRAADRRGSGPRRATATA